MRRLHIVVGIASFVVGLLTPVATSAEDPESAGGLMEAMLAFSGAEREDFLVGAIPEGVESYILVHPDARIVGSRRDEESVSVLADVHMTPDGARSWIDQAYEALGWNEVKFTSPRGGFNSSRPDGPRNFCQEGWGVRVTIREHEGGSRLRYRVRSENRRLCDAMVSQKTRWDDQFDFPPLAAPEGHEHEGCSGSRGDGVEGIETVLSTQLDASSVLAHYSAQLDRSGWEPVASCWDGPLAVQAWNVDAERAEPMAGLLMVYSLEDGVSVSLSVGRPSEEH